MYSFTRRRLIVVLVVDVVDVVVVVGRTLVSEVEEPSVTTVVVV